MTLIKFEPLRDLEHFTNRIQRFFGDYNGMDWGFSFNPKIDISEDENSIYVEAEIPGVKKEDLNISIQDNILTISGDKKTESQEENKSKNYFRTERTYGSFTRSFTLPSEIKSESIDAQFDNGILKVKIEREKPKAIKQKRIEIK